MHEQQPSYARTAAVVCKADSRCAFVCSPSAASDLASVYLIEWRWDGRVGYVQAKGPEMKLTWVVVGQVHDRMSWHLGVSTLGGGCGRAARRDGSGEGDDVVADLGGGSWALLAGVVGRRGRFCK